MRLNEILQLAGAKKSRKRVGRGHGAGSGKTSGRGHKGRGQRAGISIRIGYEGGQNPLIARSPKRGFSNVQFRKPSQIVNLCDLEERFEDGARVDAEALVAVRLIDDPSVPIKVLAKGEMTKKLTVVAAKFSGQATAKIEAAGGSCEQV
jgi:large subunit ribosomal protein L15